MKNKKTVHNLKIDRQSCKHQNYAFKQKVDQFLKQSSSMEGKILAKNFNFSNFEPDSLVTPDTTSPSEPTESPKYAKKIRAINFQIQLS